MAKMRKRTKFSLVGAIIAALAVAGAALAIGLGAVALLPQLIAFDIAIFAGGVAIAGGIAAGSFSLTGLFSRKKAQIKNADSVAEMAKVGMLDNENSNYHSVVKVRDNSFKAARNYIKSSYGLTKFNIAPVTSERQRAGINAEQLKYANKRYVYGLVGDFYTKEGKTRKARKIDKKRQNVERKLNNMEAPDVSAFAPKYHVASEYFNPVSSTWENDERSSVDFNNNQTAEAARKLFSDTVRERYSKSNKCRGATVITIRSRSNEEVKEVSASVNAEELVDKMEMLALLDYAMTAEKTGVNGFPISVETQDYKLDGRKKGKQSIVLIRNQAELKERLNMLKEASTEKDKPKEITYNR